jgi:hypothetical protein
MCVRVCASMYISVCRIIIPLNEAGSNDFVDWVKYVTNDILQTVLELAV